MPTVDDAEESIGFGGTVEIDDNGNGSAPDQSSFANLANVITLGIPSPKMGVAESKRLTLARVRKIATIEDGGEFSIRQQFTHAGYERMQAHRAAKHRLTFRVTVPDDDGDTVIEVVGLVTENKTDALEVEKITEFETMVTVAE
jgi:hypothetical protein